MAKDINQVVLVGNLVADPEFFERNGRTSAKLLVATGKVPSRHDFDDDEDDHFARKETVITEVRVHVNHIVDLCERLLKGDRVVVGGELRHTRQKSYVILLAPQARFYKVD